MDFSETPLPVELISFTSEQKNGTVELSWATAKELNNDYFEVQRSVDGQFENITRIIGHGTTSGTTHYEFIDSTPISGINYYRLRQVDYDGTVDFSKIIKIDRQPSLNVFPNPACNFIKLRTANEALTKVTIYDLNGNARYSEKFNSVAHIYNLTVQSNLSKETIQLQIK